MNFAIKPPSLRKQSSQLANQQVAEMGCCFPLFTSNFGSIDQQKNATVKRYSQSKIKKEKKIDLLIVKKGYSQPKSQRLAQAGSSNQNQTNKNQLKTIQNTTNLTSLTSKITTQRNSLKNSMIKLSLDHKVKNSEIQNKKQKSLVFPHRHSNCNEKPLVQPQAKVQMTNIQFISEISMIEQQFVSYDSTALNALNFLSNFPFSQSKGHEAVTPVRYMIDAINEKRNNQTKQMPNPLQKLSYKKKIASNDNPRQRLYL